MSDPLRNLLDHTRGIIDHAEPTTADPKGWYHTLTSLAAEARKIDLGTSGVSWEALDERIKRLEHSCLALALHFAFWRGERQRWVSALRPVEIDDAPFREFGEEVSSLLRAYDLPDEPCTSVGDQARPAD